MPYEDLIGLSVCLGIVIVVLVCLLCMMNGTVKALKADLQDCRSRYEALATTETLARRNAETDLAVLVRNLRILTGDEQLS